MTSYPGSIDTFVNPNAAAGDTLASVPHDAQHDHINDAVKAVETQLGTTSNFNFCLVANNLSELVASTARTNLGLGSAATHAAADFDAAGSASAALATAEAYTDAHVPAAANPTATIGTAAVNGTAATFMRSDAAPAFGNLTGDVTSTGMATTVAKIQGTAVTGTTGTGNVVLSASPAITGTLTGAAANWSGVQTIAVAAGTGTQSPSLTITGPAHTALTASTESIGANLNFSATKQFATGAITTQREVVIQAPTYSAVGASTITNAATVEIGGAPVAGTNVTITNSHAFAHQGWNHCRYSTDDSRIQRDDIIQSDSSL